MKKIILLMVVVVGVLAGCSSSQVDSGDMRTIQTIKGDISIPVNPKNIVVQNYTGSILALGVTPVGYEKSFYGNNELTDLLTNSKELSTPMNPEEVLGLSPDLIIISDESQYEVLSKVAPVVLIPYNTYKTNQEEITALGDVLNKKDEALDFNNKYEAFIESSREQVKDIIAKKPTFSILGYVGGGDIYAYGDNWGRAGQIIYNILGFEAPEKIKNDVIDKEGYLAISEETLGQYQADYIIMATLGGTSDVIENLSQKQVYKDLDAVKNNKIIFIQEELYFDTDPISVMKQTPKIIEQIKALNE